MKKMKSFATVSVLCLGIAAVANTHAHGKQYIDGYKDNGSGFCTLKVAQACSDKVGSDCVDGSGAPLYLLNNFGPCTVHLSKY